MLEVKTEKEDLVNHPTHYCKYNVELESIDVTDLFTFNLGSCMKYSIRYRDKENPVMDLEKAIWYAKRINKFDRKRSKAIKQLKKYRPVLEIYRDKARDCITAETIDKFIACIKDKRMNPVLELLRDRLDREKQKPLTCDFSEETK